MTSALRTIRCTCHCNVIPTFNAPSILFFFVIVVGDLGPVYGFQWRHFGAEYVDMNHDYTGSGVDQLMDCIRKIKDTPEDRRIIMSAWNPSDLSKMALPPCHMFCQFYVADGTLSCQVNIIETASIR